METWTVVLKTPGGIEIVEIEADHLRDESTIPGFTDYVLLDASANVVAHFPKVNVLGIYKGRRTQFNVTIEPVGDNGD